MCKSSFGHAKTIAFHIYIYIYMCKSRFGNNSTIAFHIYIYIYMYMCKSSSGNAEESPSGHDLEETRLFQY